MIDPLSFTANVGILFIYPNYFRTFLIEIPSFLIKTPVILFKDGVFTVVECVLVMLKEFPPIIERNAIYASLGNLINVLRLKFRLLIEIEGKTVFYSFFILPKLPLNKDQFANILLKK